MMRPARRTRRRFRLISRVCVTALTIAFDRPPPTSSAARSRWRRLDHGDRRRPAIPLPLSERGRRQSSSVEIAAHRVAVEACGLELAHDHADVFLAEVLSPVTRNRDHDAGLMAEAPMARSLTAEFGKAVIDQPGCERSAGNLLIGEFSDVAGTDAPLRSFRC
jgi:hypothetical protein